MASPIVGIALSWTTAVSLAIAGVMAGLILLIAPRLAWIRNRAAARS